MFAASEPFLLFDYFRVPYERAEDAPDGPGADARPGAALGSVRPLDGGSATLLWARRPPAPRGGNAGRLQIDAVSIFASVLPDEEAESLLSTRDGEWRRSRPIFDAAGNAVASIWTDSEGSTFLPFDPNEVIERYWTESYLDLGGSGWRRSLHRALVRAYYVARPLIPRGSRTAARHWFSRRQSKTQFPAWPVETSLHDFYGMLFSTLAELAPEPIPMISLWPSEHSWALVLTHDVETAAGYENIQPLCDIETSAGYRSSWNFVPRNHDPARDDVLEGLGANGFEVGVHGLYHDGRDIAEIDTRLAEIRSYAERWQATGFRSPATHRCPKTMPRLGFDYDSSYFDTSPYEPQPGGCCTWLPYMLGNLVELPITLPQDHTLYEVLRLEDASIWLDKTRFLRSQNGMALVLTHPDYCDNEHLVAAYRAVLDEFAEDSTAWKALPREVGEWWRQRAASELRARDGGWEIVGPAADRGTVQLFPDGVGLEPASRTPVPVTSP